MEAYLLYSSLTLFAMGCLALFLSVFFRLKSRAINNISTKLEPRIFDKTFSVFNPYPERRKMIHSFLPVLMTVVVIASFGSLLIAMRIFEAGLLLSLFILIICLDLIVVDVAPETYMNTNAFIRAIHCGTSLGVGDLKVFQLLIRALPRLSNYYLGLSIFFIALGATLSYIWLTVLMFFARFIGLTFGIGEAAGWMGWAIPVILFVIAVVFIQTLVWKTRSYLTDMPDRFDEHERARPAVREE